MQLVQKTEHINWAWFGIPDTAQKKLLPECNILEGEELQESTKSYKIIIFFYQKVRYFHFLWQLIWPRWFNFLVHDLSVYIWLVFTSVFHMLLVYNRKKKITKKWKKEKNPSYLSILFFGACNHQCCTETYVHSVESVLVTNMWSK